jgi:large subunit ribosomal protein LP0
MTSVEPPKSKRKIRKEKYVAKLKDALQDYHNIIIVQVDNVGSNQMQKVRIALRGKAIVLMGKNTIIRKIVREFIPTKPELEALLPYVFGNIGFVFTNGDLKEVRKIILDNKVPAAAKSGTVAPNEVVIPAGSTGMDPGQTAFFQALNIATKIVKGAIEIINAVTLIKPGDKVTSSHVALLDKLNIRPFSYGFKVTDVYEGGVVYASAILDVSQEDLLGKFFNGVSKLAAISVAIGYPTLATVPYLLGNAFRKLLAISVATEYTFKEAQKFKDYLADPSKFAVAAAPVAAAAAPAAKETKKEEKPKEEEEDDDGMGGGFGDLFG